MKRSVYFFSTVILLFVLGGLFENDIYVLLYIVLFTIISYFRFKDAGIKAFWLLAILIPGAMLIIWLVGIFIKSKEKQKIVNHTSDSDIVENKNNFSNNETEKIVSVDEKVEIWHNAVKKTSHEKDNR
jgi:energy-coupling factor transporter transmembrane protein EcfT